MIALVTCRHQFNLHSNAVRQGTGSLFSGKDVADGTSREVAEQETDDALLAAERTTFGNNAQGFAA
jgi:hypothetical protein